ncbi:MAG TPA: hypothetical protein VGD58_26470 [Herpetosiphonaceae bacterium]
MFLEIETERLRLRLPRTADAESIVAVNNHRAVFERICRQRSDTLPVDSITPCCMTIWIDAQLSPALASWSKAES